MEDELWIGWMEPDGTFFEAISDDGGDTGNHQTCAEDIVRGYLELDEESVLPSREQDHLHYAGWVRIDYHTTVGPSRPTLAQVNALFDMAADVKGPMAEGVRIYLEHIEGIEEKQP